MDFVINKAFFSFFISMTAPVVAYTWPKLFSQYLVIFLVLCPTFLFLKLFIPTVPSSLCLTLSASLCYTALILYFFASSNFDQMYWHLMCWVFFNLKECYFLKILMSITASSEKPALRFILSALKDELLAVLILYHYHTRPFSEFYRIGWYLDTCHSVITRVITCLLFYLQC